MKNHLNIGCVIADIDEFAPLYDMKEELAAEEISVFKRKGLRFKLKNGEKSVTVTALHCGIGMVNAASFATYLVDSGAEVLLNAGLSGGISNIARGEIMCADKYIEHDFDLTPLGYAPCEKPGQEYIYSADNKLVALAKKLFPEIKTGTAVSGDSFISDAEKKQYLKDTFGAMSCDMESGAIASVCHSADIPFLSIRRVSDDAGDSAVDSYVSMNSLREAVLCDLLVDMCKGILECENFFI